MYTLQDPLDFIISFLEILIYKLIFTCLDHNMLNINYQLDHGLWFLFILLINYFTHTKSNIREV